MKIFGLLGIPVIESCSSEDFPEKVPNLFNIAKQEILISTDLHPDFYNNESVKASIKAAINRNVDIEILIDKGPHDIFKIQWLKENLDKGRIKAFYSKDKIRHIIVADGKHIREETTHDRSNYDKAKNDIIINAGSIAAFTRDTLKLMMSESEPYKTDKTNDKNSKNV
ncbi:MAG: hypothetical protein CVT88_07320 [Candidatus Altiarchaeales archaeon HGW-Altiarchaeales-1]|nr:MAG: hypothetical protein CVT88_07320 [Candidatus Altiarchaeales archaeon HGW-Altiarchaeales-1]